MVNPYPPSIRNQSFEISKQWPATLVRLDITQLYFYGTLNVNKHVFIRFRVHFHRFSYFPTWFRTYTPQKNCQKWRKVVKMVEITLKNMSFWSQNQ